MTELSHQEDQERPARKARSGSSKRQRALFINVRLTDDEHAAMTAAAEDAGMTPAAFIRHRCIGTAGPRTVRRPPVDSAALGSILAQLGKCGSNLNQIARALNSDREIPHDPADAITRFERVCDEIMDALGKGRAA